MFAETELIIAGLAATTVGTILLGCIIYLRRLAHEISASNREVYGLTKKMEAMTASRRAHFVHEYDKIVNQLLRKLPANIAAQAGDSIFVTQKEILTRLAELEKVTGKSKESSKQMEQIILSMEQLEAQLVRVTADTVIEVMGDTRKRILEDERFADLSSAV